jgi:hypothetical protein
MLLAALLSLLISECDTTLIIQHQYIWCNDYRESNAIACRISPPEGFVRDSLAGGSFGEWLSHLPLKAGRPAVLLYNGDRKVNQNAHYAVLDIDTGKRDLQQCADAVIRLRAEYLYQQKSYLDIHFNFTSGDNMAFDDWSRGVRPIVLGSLVTFKKLKAPDSSYSSFREYLDKVFSYAGTKSLHKELHHIKLSEMQIGDVFIQSGRVGHAVIVVDMALNRKTGEKLFLLAQSYMPAQDIHILVNPQNETSPWYSLNFTGNLETPEWRFSEKDLYRF